jgi:hypothetical protein
MSSSQSSLPSSSLPSHSIINQSLSSPTPIPSPSSESSSPSSHSTPSRPLTSTLSGAAAGFFVDLSLYPLDTIKIRLQSKDGFLKSGGFTNLYRGIGPIFAGSS